ncbi:MAG: DUF4476 domain-containing protein [Bacteroidales bacterium]|nr:DUF4476 domain-containing protein [Bacteroidales bacterium]
MKRILTLAALVLLSTMVMAQPGNHGNHHNPPHPPAQGGISLKVRAFITEKFIVTLDGRRQEGYASKSYTFTGLRPGRHDLVVELTSPAKSTRRLTVDLQSKDEEYMVQWKNTPHGGELIVESLDAFLYGQGGTGRAHTSQPPTTVTPPADRNGSYRDGYQDGYRDGWRDAMQSLTAVPVAPIEVIDPGMVAAEMMPVATPEEVARMVAQLKAESFDDNRMELAQAMVTSKLLTTADIRRMIGTFQFEDNKLDFAKYAYAYVADPENYFKVASDFTFASNKSDLLNYIKK